jgi:hypothetical protein
MLEKENHMSKTAVETTFSEFETLTVGDWIEKVRAWIAKVEQELEGYEISESTLEITAPPSLSITLSKKRPRGNTKSKSAK